MCRVWDFAGWGFFAREMGLDFVRGWGDVGFGFLFEWGDGLGRFCFCSAVSHGR